MAVIISAACWAIRTTASFEGTIDTIARSERRHRARQKPIEVVAPSPEIECKLTRSPMLNKALASFGGSTTFRPNSSTSDPLGTRSQSDFR
jgi:hypothetical protein